MRCFWLLGFSVALIFSGCSSRKHRSPSQFQRSYYESQAMQMEQMTYPAGDVTAVQPSPVPNANTPAALVGTWHWQDEQMLVELSPTAEWRWSNLEPNGQLDPPFVGGKWFVTEDELYLRVDYVSEGASHSFTVGMAIVFKAIAVNPDELRLQSPATEREIVWRRVAEPSGTP